MTYSTVIDVRNALAPVGEWDDGTTAAKLSDPQILDAILEADARIDAYIPSGYAVPRVDVEQGDPLATVNVAHPLFRFMSRDIAAYLITLTFMRNKDIVEDDPIRLRYELATGLLAGFRTGDVNVPGADSADANLSVYNQYDGNLFSMSDLALVPGYPAGSFYRYRTLDLI